MRLIKKSSKQARARRHQFLPKKARAQIKLKGKFLQAQACLGSKFKAKARLGLGQNWFVPPPIISPSASPSTSTSTSTQGQKSLTQTRVQRLISYLASACTAAGLKNRTTNRTSISFYRHLNSLICPKMFVGK